MTVPSAQNMRDYILSVTGQLAVMTITLFIIELFNKRKNGERP